MEQIMSNENLEENNDKLLSYNDHYSALKYLVESLEEDILKSNKGNKSAGVRLRKSLRSLKSYSQDFIKFTLGKD